MIQTKDLLNFIPFLITAVLSLILVIITSFSGKKIFPVFILTILGIVFSITSSFFRTEQELILFSNLIRVNSISTAFSVIAQITVLICVISSADYIKKLNINFGEYYSLIVFSLLGMMMMIFSNDMIVLFVGLETMSVCFYVLSGMLRKRVKSNESALKYFLIGSFMTGFLLYGIALIYGVTGSTNFNQIFVSVQNFKNPVFLAGLGLFLSGFLFKIGIFPFHMWIPDVYEGAPTIVSGLMSTSGKIAAVGILSVILNGMNLSDYKILFSVLAVLTMLFGNILAVMQTNLKRLLAYSSIASAGYILVGLTAFDDFSQKGVAYYLMAYGFMQFGGFIALSVYESVGENDFTRITLDDYKGLGRRNPLLSIFFSIFLFSLSGIPPFAGFWGKYYLFYAAIKANLIWLSIIAIILSLISVYYYLKITVYIWFKDSDSSAILSNNNNKFLSNFALAVCTAGTLIFGIYPQLFFDIFKLAIK